MLRRYAISYLTSAAQALSVRGAATSPQPEKRLFAMANPTATGAAMPASPTDDPLKRQLRSGRLGEFLTPVPGAEAEVRQIASSFSPDATTVVSGANATEAAYKTQAPRHRIVHFATHAVASDGQPLYSTRILAPDSMANDDGS